MIQDTGQTHGYSRGGGSAADTHQPNTVRLLDLKLSEAGVWHSITRNQGHVTSCHEAARARRRLGVIGIPLCDELKTHLASYTTIDGEYRYVAVHCRGNQRRDDAKLARILGCQATRVEADELSSKFGMEYGRVNPFSLADRIDTLQLFDAGVLVEHAPPSTMMTNADDFTWGIEFSPADVIAWIPRAQVVDVAKASAAVPAKPPVLGILTGNGPDSGIELWNRINAAIQSGANALHGDINYPSVVVASLPEMGITMELPIREASARRVVCKGIDTLAAAGATVIGVACNTSQYFSSDIRSRCSTLGIEFVSMVDSAQEVLLDRGDVCFDLIGIGPVTDLQRWSDFRRLTHQFTVAVPSADDINAITALAWEIKAEGPAISGSALEKLQHLIHHAVSTNTVLIALTELSVALAKHPKVKTNLEAETGKTIIDLLTVLADKMAAYYVGYRRLLDTDSRDDQSSHLT